MSTAPHQLYAVPPPTTPTQPNGQLPRLAWLLQVRQAARQAFDLALALPKRAADWALRQARTATSRVLSADPSGWASRGLHASAAMVTRVGIVPLGLVAATAPPVRRLLARGATTCARWTASLVRRGWAATKALLTRAGTPGAAVVNTLERWTTTATNVATRAGTTKAFLAVTAVVRQGLAAVTPLSRMFVLHRLLSLLIPTIWIRAVLEAIVIPLVAPNAVRRPIRTSPPAGAAAPATVTVPEVGSQKARMTSDGTATTNGTDTTEVTIDPEVDEVVEAGVFSQDDTEPLNRAERRAMQQTQARARKAGTRRPAAS